jgi:hypothetical protein
MNAMQEMLDLINTSAQTGIRCAKILVSSDGWSADKTIILKDNYTHQELIKFFEELDFEYDDGFGNQEIFGTVWFLDGTYADRGEYDGSECWRVHGTPDIPNDLIKGE